MCCPKLFRPSFPSLKLLHSFTTTTMLQTTLGCIFENSATENRTFGVNVQKEKKNVVEQQYPIVEQEHSFKNV